jgi:hypothetical protein
VPVMIEAVTLGWILARNRVFDIDYRIGFNLMYFKVLLVDVGLE